MQSYRSIPLDPSLPLSDPFSHIYKYQHHRSEAKTSTAILLSGCTSASSTIPSIYLTSISYQNVTNKPASSQVNPAISKTFADLVNGTAMEVRTGYFGICVSYEGGIWLCNNNAAGLARQFQPNQDPLNLIWASAEFKDGIVFPGLLYALILPFPFLASALSVLLLFICLPTLSSLQSS